MRLSNWMITLVASLSVSFASDSTKILTELLAALPSCALTCLGQASANSTLFTCSFTDTQCFCTNEPLIEALAICLEAGCTVREVLTTRNVTSIACNAPIRDRRAFYKRLSNALAFFSGLIVGLKLLSTYLHGSNFWFDDYMLLLTILIGIPSAVTNAHNLPENGFGMDIWKVPFNSITNVFHLLFTDQLLYITQLSMMKISLCLFYIRLFSDDTVRKIIWGTIAFHIVLAVVFDFVLLFQCRPISYFWKSWDGEHQGSCLNTIVLGCTASSIGIAMDIWLLMIPVTQVIPINLHWKKKIGVLMMFGVGFFVTAVSILRLRALIPLFHSQNPTWEFVPVFLWSTVEINIGVVCACMPAIRLLLIRVIPKIMGSTNEFSNNSAKKNERIKMQRVVASDELVSSKSGEIVSSKGGERVNLTSINVES